MRKVRVIQVVVVAVLIAGAAVLAVLRHPAGGNPQVAAPTDRVTPHAPTLSLSSTQAVRVPRIVFSSHRNGQYDIYTMNPDGSDVRQLTNGGDNRSPKWSPDGTRIAWAGLSKDDKIDLFVMSADGSHVIQL